VSRPGRLVVTLAGAAALAGPLGAQESDMARSQRQIEDRAAVLETVRELFRALGSRDLARIEELHLPQALTVTSRSAGESEYPAVRTVPEVLESIGSVTVPMLERMWDAEVRVDGDIASVWTPYDFWVDGSFSHCGHDAVHLVRVNGSWRISAVTYTVAQPPECRTHPDGPPAGIGGSP
jgi:hypothetical protein